MKESLGTRVKAAFTMKADDERFSIFENFVEGFGMYFLIMWCTFRIIYQAGSVTIVDDIIRTIALGYITVVGPILHGNTPEELGIGNIQELKQRLFNKKKKPLISGVIILVFLSIVVFPIYLNNFDAVLRLVPLFGQLNLYVAAELPWLQLPLVIAEYVMFQVLMIFVLIRKDNLWTSFRSMAKGMLLLLGVIFVLSLLSLELFRIDDTIVDFFAIWYGYTIWGTLQQLPFLVYFSARFRKGLPFSRISNAINVFLLAFYFAFFHGTQWILVILAFFMEIVIARSYLHDETRNLFVAGMVHGLVGTIIIFFTGLAIKMDFV